MLFLEIDGLARADPAPGHRRRVHADAQALDRRGSHRLLAWEPDLSSQTSASQAGILLGDNTGIPAFRWYDKPAGKLMVSSKMETAKELERRLSSGEGFA